MGMAAMLVMWPNSFIQIFISILPQDCLNNFSFPRPLEATYEIWLQLA